LYGAVFNRKDSAGHSMNSSIGEQNKRSEMLLDHRARRDSTLSGGDFAFRKSG